MRQAVAAGGPSSIFNLTLTTERSKRLLQSFAAHTRIIVIEASCIRRFQEIGRVNSDAVREARNHIQLRPFRRYAKESIVTLRVPHGVPVRPAIVNALLPPLTHLTTTRCAPLDDSLRNIPDASALPERSTTRASDTLSIMRAPDRGNRRAHPGPQASVH